MTQSKTIDVSVVIVNYKTPHLLVRCLDSLQKYASYIKDIVVIDNASYDRTIEVLRQRFPYARRIASQANVGFAKAVNWGITNARKPYIMILNPDVIITPQAIPILLREIRRQPNIGLIAPRLCYPDGSIQYSCCRFQTPGYILARRSWISKTKAGQKIIDHILMKDYDHKKARDVDWVIGGAMLINRRAVEQVGLLDERFWLYFEDMDWCRSLWQHGWRVRYEPEAYMIHNHRRESAKNPGVLGLLSPLGRAHLVSAAKYYFKHIGNASKLKNKLIDR